MCARHLYSFLVAAAATAFSSCANFLEEHPSDAFDEETAFQSPTLVYVNTVASLYNNMYKVMGNDRHIYDLNTFSSDEAMLPCRIGDWEDGGLWQNIFLHRWGTMNDLTKNSWDFLYEQIGKCNQSVDKLTVFAEENPEATYFNTYLQEVRAVRAFFYYELLDLFARVPLVTSSTTPMAEVKQSDRSEVFNFVRTELEESLPYLSDSHSNQKGEYYGRLTKPVAYMILAKMALNAEVYTDDNWTDGARPNGNDIKFTVDGKQLNAWEATIAYVNKIEALGYKLQGNFTENFSVNNENSVENIFTVPMDPVSYPNAKDYNIVRTRHYDHATAFNQSGWNGACATVKAMQIFKFGTPEEDPRCQLTYFTGEVVGPDGKTIYTDWDGQKVPLKYEPLAPKVYMEATDGILVKTAGARMAKYAFDENAQDGGSLHANDCVIFRFADALLMRAEAKIRMGQSGDEEVNLVRNRVGAKPLTGVTLDDLLDERLLELAFEGVRRQDLIRYGKFTEATVDRYPGVKHSSSSLDWQEDKTGYTTVFSIYADILSLNPNLRQNYGYENQ